MNKVILKNHDRLLECSWYTLVLKLRNVKYGEWVKAYPWKIANEIIENINKHESLKALDLSRLAYRIKGGTINYRIKKGGVLPIETSIAGLSETEIAAWADAARGYFANIERNYILEEIEGPGPVSVKSLVDKTGDIKDIREICLDFKMPFFFDNKREQGKPKEYISTGQFLDILSARAGDICGYYPDYGKIKDEINVIPYYLEHKVKHWKSKRYTGNVDKIVGVCGPLYIKGNISAIFPALALCEYFQIGGCSWRSEKGPRVRYGQGYFTLEFEKNSIFKGALGNPDFLKSVIEEIKEKRDDYALELIEDFGFNGPEDLLINQLGEELSAGTYRPDVYKAFLIDKGAGKKRIIEKLSLKDITAQTAVYKLLEPVFDKAFEENSLGFRKGKSVQKAVNNVKAYIDCGYAYIAESDIEDFFPSIPHNKLEKVLSLYLPHNDLFIADIIMNSLKQGYSLEGKFYNRGDEGVPQGSPLSPLMANLYLDGFDELFLKDDTRMVRYGDDFLILAKKKKDAVKALAGAEKYLNNLGLALKAEKTAVHMADENFSFLGRDFGASGQDGYEKKPFAKPFYVTSPYLFLSVDGDILEVRKSGRIITSIPFRRISLVIILERCSFSNAFFVACNRFDIPVSMLLSNGYHIATVKPDSKRYFSISAVHKSRFESLTENEKTEIAGQIVRAKIMNYRTLFKERGIEDTVETLGQYLDLAQKSDNLEQLRGYEGKAAQVCFSSFNLCINNKDFEIQKRDRNKKDLINSILNYAYYLLFSRINSIVRVLGLNPYLGFLHSHKNDFESLVCDIQELFRARMDKFIIKLINERSLSKASFVESERRFYLTNEKRKLFLERLEKEMTVSRGKGSASLEDLIYIQAEIFRDWSQGKGGLTLYRWE